MSNRTNVISQIINSWPNRYLLKYSYFDQIRDIVPSILLSICMGVIVYTIQLLSAKPIITLVLQIIAGASLYIAGSMLFKIEEFKYIKEIVRGFYSKNKGTL